MKILLSLLMLSMISTTTYADQLEWLPKTDANKAKAVLELGPTVVLEHCEPCGENDKPAEYAVNSVSVGYEDSFSGKDYYSVRINGKAVDLAYTFVKTENFYVNLGRLVDLPSAKTSTLLSHSYVRGLFGSQPTTEKQKVCGLIDDNITPGQPQHGGDADLRVRFEGKELVLSFEKNPALAQWLQARIPLRGCIVYDGELHQGFEGTVIKAEEYTRR